MSDNMDNNVDAEFAAIVGADLPEGTVKTLSRPRNYFSGKHYSSALLSDGSEIEIETVPVGDVEVGDEIIAAGQRCEVVAVGTSATTGYVHIFYAVLIAKGKVVFAPSANSADRVCDRVKK